MVDYVYIFEKMETVLSALVVSVKYRLLSGAYRCKHMRRAHHRAFRMDYMITKVHALFYFNYKLLDISFNFYIFRHSFSMIPNIVRLGTIFHNISWITVIKKIFSHGVIFGTIWCNCLLKRIFPNWYVIWGTVSHDRYLVASGSVKQQMGELEEAKWHMHTPLNYSIIEGQMRACREFAAKHYMEQCWNVRYTFGNNLLVREY